MTHPSLIQAHLEGYHTSGENFRTASQSEVYRYQKLSKPDLFLKISHSTTDAPLINEKNAMNWLLAKLPVPHVVAYCKVQTTEYLLTTSIPGLSSESHALSTEKKPLVQILAEGLRTIHNISIANCPLPVFTAQSLLKTAHQNVTSGHITAQTLAERKDPRTPEQALTEIHALKPDGEDLVFTHGDYCLPNVMIDNNALSGFIDWGSAGIGDRHRDFVSAQYSIRRNLGAEWIDPFFDHYDRKFLNIKTLQFYNAIYNLT